MGSGIAYGKGFSLSGLQLPSVDLRRPRKRSYLVVGLAVAHLAIGGCSLGGNRATLPRVLHDIQIGMSSDKLRMDREALIDVKELAEPNGAFLQEDLVDDAHVETVTYIFDQEGLDIVTMVGPVGELRGRQAYCASLAQVLEEVERAIGQPDEVTLGTRYAGSGLKPAIRRRWFDVESVGEIVLVVPTESTLVAAVETEKRVPKSLTRWSMTFGRGRTMFGGRVLAGLGDDTAVKIRSGEDSSACRSDDVGVHDSFW